MFAISEALKAWLLENNEEYDGSMYAQMMRKQESKKIKVREDMQFLSSASLGALKWFRVFEFCDIFGLCIR